MAQGEDIEDRWWLQIVNGKAMEAPIEIKGKKLTCPHCGEEFILETES
jgi:predicted RNA-binding Zn-ribbon protein involved in translation (DUF1610 family)